MAFIKPGCYNSDFTKFHHANVRKDITLTDLDAVQFRIMEDGSERIRLIEYKGTYEAHRKMQMLVLNRFKNYIKALNSIATKTNFELYMITADFREQLVGSDSNLKHDYATVFNFLENSTKKIDENNLISFLNFNVEWKDLKEVRIGVDG